MNILLPDSWLREYLETEATPQQLKDCLSLCGPSVERINKVNNDYIYEIEITSNRVDMASVYGISREAVAILPRFGIKSKLKEFKVKTPTQPKSILPMEVYDPEMICNRIMGVVMDVEQMKESPAYIKDRIEKSGIRSLNNLVDITNYVMLELGHPCHVFDYDRIKSHKFLIRFAKKNEQIITLDNKKYLLNSEDVIIDDGTDRVIDLPGIMGTENSVVNQTTRRIFFFIESNNPLLIRKTSMRYGIRTMAATINEKHPDPELVKTALLRGIELYQGLAGGKIAGELIDIYPRKSKPTTISTTIQFINERLGIVLKKSEIVSILGSLSFHVSEQNTLLNITPPTFRQFDVTIPEDIVEEVARIYGYHNLPSKLMTGDIPITGRPKILDIEERTKEMLKYWGYTEVYNYSFISEKLIKKTDTKPSYSYLRIANPLTEDTTYMRLSLVPSMLETVSKNQFYKDRLSLFEMAKVYIPRINDLPEETSLLTIANQDSFYELKGLIEFLLKELGIDGYHLVQQTHLGWHPKQSVHFVKDDLFLLSLGKIHPWLAANFEIKKDLFIAEINVDRLAALSKPIKHYNPIPLYPEVIEDLTLQCPVKTYIGPIISEIYKINKIVKKVEMTGHYHNSTSLRITYQDEKKNLKSEDVKNVRDKILQTLISKYKITFKQ